MVSLREHAMACTPQTVQSDMAAGARPGAGAACALKGIGGGGRGTPGDAGLARAMQATYDPATVTRGAQRSGDMSSN